MSNTPGYEIGKWLVLCQRCGVKFLNDAVEKEWQGLLVCKDKCLDFRHPQDFVRSVPDDQTVPYTSPEPTDVEVSVTYIADTVGTQDLVVPTGTFDGSL